jgi:hypothetical protein
LAVLVAGCADEQVVVRWARSDEFSHPAPAPPADPVAWILVPRPTDAGCSIGGPIVRSYYGPVVEFMRRGELADLPAKTWLVEHAQDQIVRASRTKEPTLIIEPRRETGEMVVVHGAQLKLYCLHVARTGHAVSIVVDQFFRFGEP